MPKSRTLKAGRFHAEMDTAEVRGNLLDLRRTLVTELNETTEDLSLEAREIYQREAPRGRIRPRESGHRSGTLARSINSDTVQGRDSGRFGTGRNFQITMNPISPKGFNYGAVSRFGHRQIKIFPTTSRLLALPFKRDGHSVRTPWVRGFKPASDWTDVPAAMVDKIAGAEMVKLSRRLEYRGRKRVT